MVWIDALEGLDAMSFSAAAEILATAVEGLGGSPSLDRHERQNQMDAINVNFDDLDDRYGKVVRGKLDDYVLRYAKENRSSFYFNGMVKKSVGF